MKSQFKENENLDNKPRYKYAPASYRADYNAKRKRQNEKNISVMENPERLPALFPKRPKGPFFRGSNKSSF